MMDRDALSRTVKILLDSEIATSREEAEAMAQGLVVQLDLGHGIEGSAAAQAAAITAVNAGHRAFLGGVLVRIVDDPVLAHGWARGMNLSTAIEYWGGRVVEHLDGAQPIVCIGKEAARGAGTVAISAVWSGWAGGVTDDGWPGDSDALPLAGVLAGSMAVSECFQHALGNPVAARRSVGISLWRPDLDWRDGRAQGPTLLLLPSRVWLLGLGHLGQAYAWGLGWLPYSNRSKVHMMLQDTDRLVDANRSTGLLSMVTDLTGTPKTRLVSRRLEALGFSTAMVERSFDANTVRAPNEPGLALAGFDDPVPRRHLGSAGFERIVDGGLGAGPWDYLDMVIHSFPSGLDPATAFPDESRVGRALAPAYESEICDRIASGQGEGEARCGVVEIAGRSVGAAFVGAMAGAVVLSEPLRSLTGGASYEVISLDLRSPSAVKTATNNQGGPATNTGFLLASTS